MSLGARLRGLFSGGEKKEVVRVHVLLKGRIGLGWQDVDRTFELPKGATLQTLLEAAEREGVSLKDAIENSPHLKHTLMKNGERCPVDEHLDDPLHDGDEIYLLAPFAGG